MKRVSSDVPTIEEIQSLYDKGNIEELRAMNERLAKRSNQRMTSLKKAGFDETAAISRAKKDIKDIKITTGKYSRSKKLDLDTLYKQVKSEANFLRWQTSTVSGELQRRERIWEGLTSQRINEEGKIVDPVISLLGVEDVEAYKKKFLKFLDTNAWEELKKHLYTKTNILLDEAGEAISSGANIQDLKDAIQKYMDGDHSKDLITIWDNWISIT